MEKLEDKLKLSGGELAVYDSKITREIESRANSMRSEIGHALLQRYEALEEKLAREVEKYEKLVSEVCFD